MIVWTVGRKKDKTSPNCPRQTGPRLNAGLFTPLCCFPLKKSLLWLVVVTLYDLLIEFAVHAF